MWTIVCIQMFAISLSCSSFSEHEFLKKIKQLDSVTSQVKNAAGHVGYINFAQ